MDYYDFSRPELPSRLVAVTHSIQNEIVSCFNCEYHDGDVLWLRGDCQEVGDLLDHFDVAETDWETVIPHLSCPCGQSDFHSSDEIGVRSKYEKEVEAHVEKSFEIYGDDLIRFNDLLFNYPMLAADDEFGKLIITEIKNRTLPICIVNGEFYRARMANSAVIMTVADLLTPPLGIPTEGRFNHSGQSHLYLSSTETTAKEETTGGHSSIVWTARLSVTEPIENILDLTFDLGSVSPTTSLLLIALNYASPLSRTAKHVHLWRPDYFISRFIMDIAKQQGYNGIKYNSVHNRYDENVVLFYPDKCKLIALEEPKIGRFESSLKIEPDLPDDLPI